MGRIRPRPHPRHSASFWRRAILRRFPVRAGNPDMVLYFLASVLRVRKYDISDTPQRFSAAPPEGWPEPIPPPAPRPANRCLPKGFEAASLPRDCMLTLCCASR
ncbi:hypothetical protein E4T38_05196 [Aureobasidium subglaciale]|nr:hypothetical protein E4T38_05196 [Aureobasidium subglaciale]KAI5220320.1 hypothetical protein E4T40_05960 [Aureobasidium subglaciale]KAI5222945.1 hypothetical protein E4T41_06386 [Aureobasidium subglaciale]KAI5260169.1 hypothetical protein E4T46_06268 [Aureobasidium subglaciale]